MMTTSWHQQNILMHSHLWSLVVTRGHSWPFVVFRGHSCVLLDTILKNSEINISTLTFTQLQYATKLKTTKLRFTCKNGHVTNKSSGIWNISFQSQSDCLEPVRRPSVLTSDNSGMCLAFYETAATCLGTSRRLIMLDEISVGLSSACL